MEYVSSSTRKCQQQKQQGEQHLDQHLHQLEPSLLAYDPRDSDLPKPLHGGDTTSISVRDARVVCGNGGDGVGSGDIAGVSAGGVTNPNECRRSSRKKIIKFDVCKLLSKHRKTHKIKIEARIDSLTPTTSGPLETQTQLRTATNIKSLKQQPQQEYESPSIHKTDSSIEQVIIGSSAIVAPKNQLKTTDGNISKIDSLNKSSHSLIIAQVASDTNTAVAITNKKSELNKQSLLKPTTIRKRGRPPKTNNIDINIDQMIESVKVPANIVANASHVMRKHGLKASAASNLKFNNDSQVKTQQISNIGTTQFKLPKKNLHVRLARKRLPPLQQFNKIKAIPEIQLTATNITNADKIIANSGTPSNATSNTRLKLSKNIPVQLNFQRQEVKLNDFSEQVNCVRTISPAIGLLKCKEVDEQTSSTEDSLFNYESTSSDSNACERDSTVTSDTLSQLNVRRSRRKSIRGGQLFNQNKSKTLEETFAAIAAESYKTTLINGNSSSNSSSSSSISSSFIKENPLNCDRVLHGNGSSIYAKSTDDKLKDTQFRKTCRKRICQEVQSLKNIPHKVFGHGIKKTEKTTQLKHKNIGIKNNYKTWLNKWKTKVKMQSQPTSDVKKCENITNDTSSRTSSLNIDEICKQYGCHEFKVKIHKSKLFPNCIIHGANSILCEQARRNSDNVVISETTNDSADCNSPGKLSKQLRRKTYDAKLNEIVKPLSDNDNAIIKSSINSTESDALSQEFDCQSFQLKLHRNILPGSTANNIQIKQSNLKLDAQAIVEESKLDPKQSNSVTKADVNNLIINAKIPINSIADAKLNDNQNVNRGYTRSAGTNLIDVLRERYKSGGGAVVLKYGLHKAESKSLKNVMPINSIYNVDVNKPTTSTIDGINSNSKDQPLQTAVIKVLESPVKIQNSIKSKMNIQANPEEQRSKIIEIKTLAPSLRTCDTSKTNGGVIGSSVKYVNKVIEDKISDGINEITAKVEQHILTDGIKANKLVDAISEDKICAMSTADSESSVEKKAHTINNVEITNDVLLNQQMDEMINVPLKKSILGSNDACTSKSLLQPAAKYVNVDDNILDDNGINCNEYARTLATKNSNDDNKIQIIKTVDSDVDTMITETSLRANSEVEVKISGARSDKCSGDKSAIESISETLEPNIKSKFSSNNLVESIDKLTSKEDQRKGRHNLEADVSDNIGGNYIEFAEKDVHTETSVNATAKAGKNDAIVGDANVNILVASTIKNVNQLIEANGSNSLNAGNFEHSNTKIIAESIKKAAHLEVKKRKTMDSKKYEITSTDAYDNNIKNVIELRSKEAPQLTVTTIETKRNRAVHDNDNDSETIIQSKAKKQKVLESLLTESDIETLNGNRDTDCPNLSRSANISRIRNTHHNQRRRETNQKVINNKPAKKRSASIASLSDCGTKVSTNKIFKSRRTLSNLSLNNQTDCATILNNNILMKQEYQMLCSDKTPESSAIKIEIKYSSVCADTNQAGCSTKDIYDNTFINKEDIKSKGKYSESHNKETPKGKIKTSSKRKCDGFNPLNSNTKATDHNILTEIEDTKRKGMYLEAFAQEHSKAKTKLRRKTVRNDFTRKNGNATRIANNILTDKKDLVSSEKTDCSGSNQVNKATKCNDDNILTKMEATKCKGKSLEELAKEPSKAKRRMRSKTVCEGSNQSDCNTTDTNDAPTSAASEAKIKIRRKKDFGPPNQVGSGRKGNADNILTKMEATTCKGKSLEELAQEPSKAKRRMRSKTVCEGSNQSDCNIAGTGDNKEDTVFSEKSLKAFTSETSKAKIKMRRKTEYAGSNQVGSGTKGNNDNILTKMEDAKCKGKYLEELAQEPPKAKRRMRSKTVCEGANQSDCNTAGTGDNKEDTVFSEKSLKAFTSETSKAKIKVRRKTEYGAPNQVGSGRKGKYDNFLTKMETTKCKGKSLEELAEEPSKAKRRMRSKTVCGGSNQSDCNTAGTGDNKEDTVFIEKSLKAFTSETSKAKIKMRRKTEYVGSNQVGSGTKRNDDNILTKIEATKRKGKSLEELAQEPSKAKRRMRSKTVCERSSQSDCNTAGTGDNKEDTVFSEKSLKAFTSETSKAKIKMRRKTEYGAPSQVGSGRKGKYDNFLTKMEATKCKGKSLEELANEPSKARRRMRSKTVCEGANQSDCNTAGTGDNKEDTVFSEKSLKAFTSETSKAKIKMRRKTEYVGSNQVGSGTKRNDENILTKMEATKRKGKSLEELAQEPSKAKRRMRSKTVCEGSNQSDCNTTGASTSAVSEAKIKMRRKTEYGISNQVGSGTKRNVNNILTQMEDINCKGKYLEQLTQEPSKVKRRKRCKKICEESNQSDCSTTDTGASEAKIKIRRKTEYGGVNQVDSGEKEKLAQEPSKAKRVTRRKTIYEGSNQSDCNTIDASTSAPSKAKTKISRKTECGGSNQEGSGRKGNDDNILTKMEATKCKGKSLEELAQVPSKAKRRMRSKTVCEGSNQSDWNTTDTSDASTSAPSKAKTKISRKTECGGSNQEGSGRKGNDDNILTTMEATKCKGKSLEELAQVPSKAKRRMRSKTVCEGSTHSDLNTTDTSDAPTSAASEAKIKIRRKKDFGAPNQVGSGRKGNDDNILTKIEATKCKGKSIEELAQEPSKAKRRMRSKTVCEGSNQSDCNTAGTGDNKEDTVFSEKSLKAFIFETSKAKIKMRRKTEYGAPNQVGSGTKGNNDNILTKMEDAKCKGKYLEELAQEPSKAKRRMRSKTVCERSSQTDCNTAGTGDNKEDTVFSEKAVKAFTSETSKRKIKMRRKTEYGAPNQVGSGRKGKYDNILTKMEAKKCKGKSLEELAQEPSKAKRRMRRKTIYEGSNQSDCNTTDTGDAPPSAASEAKIKIRRKTEFGAANQVGSGTKGNDGNILTKMEDIKRKGKYLEQLAQAPFKTKRRMRSKTIRDGSNQSDCNTTDTSDAPPSAASEAKIKIRRRTEFGAPNQVGSGRKGNDDNILTQMEDINCKGKYLEQLVQEPSIAKRRKRRKTIYERSNQSDCSTTDSSDATTSAAYEAKIKIRRKTEFGAPNQVGSGRKTNSDNIFTGMEDTNCKGKYLEELHQAPSKAQRRMRRNTICEGSNQSDCNTASAGDNIYLNTAGILFSEKSSKAFTSETTEAKTKMRRTTECVELNQVGNDRKDNDGNILTELDDTKCKGKYLDELAQEPSKAKRRMRRKTICEGSNQSDCNTASTGDNMYLNTAGIVFSEKSSEAFTSETSEAKTKMRRTTEFGGSNQVVSGTKCNDDNILTKMEDVKCKGNYLEELAQEPSKVKRRMRRRTISEGSYQSDYNTASTGDNIYLNSEDIVFSEKSLEAYASEASKAKIKMRRKTYCGGPSQVGNGRKSNDDNVLIQMEDINCNRKYLEQLAQNPSNAKGWMTPRTICEGFNQSDGNTSSTGDNIYLNNEDVVFSEKSLEAFASEASKTKITMRCKTECGGSNQVVSGTKCNDDNILTKMKDIKCKGKYLEELAQEPSKAKRRMRRSTICEGSYQSDYNTAGTGDNIHLNNEDVVFIEKSLEAFASEASKAKIKMRRKTDCGGPNQVCSGRKGNDNVLTQIEDINCNRKYLEQLAQETSKAKRWMRRRTICEESNQSDGNTASTGDNIYLNSEDIVFSEKSLEAFASEASEAKTKMRSTKECGGPNQVGSGRKGNDDNVLTQMEDINCNGKYLEQLAQEPSKAKRSMRPRTISEGSNQSDGNTASTGDNIYLNNEDVVLSEKSLEVLASEASKAKITMRRKTEFGGSNQVVNGTKCNDDNILTKMEDIKCKGKYLEELAQEPSEAKRRMRRRTISEGSYQSHYNTASTGDNIHLNNEDVVFSEKSVEALASEASKAKITMRRKTEFGGSNQVVSGTKCNDDNILTKMEDIKCKGKYLEELAQEPSEAKRRMRRRTICEGSYQSHYNTTSTGDNIYLNSEDIVFSEKPLEAFASEASEAKTKMVTTECGGPNQVGSGRKGNDDNVLTQMEDINCNGKYLEQLAQEPSKAKRSMRPRTISEVSNQSDGNTVNTGDNNYLNNENIALNEKSLEAFTSETSVAKIEMRPKAECGAPNQVGSGRKGNDDNILTKMEDCKGNYLEELAQELSKAKRRMRRKTICEGSNQLDCNTIGASTSTPSKAKTIIRRKTECGGSNQVDSGRKECGSRKCEGFNQSDCNLATAVDNIYLNKEVIVFSEKSLEAFASDASGAKVKMILETKCGGSNPVGRGTKGNNDTILTKMEDIKCKGKYLEELTQVLSKARRWMRRKTVCEGANHTDCNTPGASISKPPKAKTKIRRKTESDGSNQIDFGTKSIDNFFINKNDICVRMSSKRFPIESSKAKINMRRRTDGDGSKVKVQGFESNKDSLSAVEPVKINEKRLLNASTKIRRTRSQDTVIMQKNMQLKLKKQPRIFEILNEHNCVLGLNAKRSNKLAVGSRRICKRRQTTSLELSFEGERVVRRSYSVDDHLNSSKLTSEMLDPDRKCINEITKQAENVQSSRDKLEFKEIKNNASQLNIAMLFKQIESEHSLKKTEDDCKSSTPSLSVGKERKQLDASKLLSIKKPNANNKRSCKKSSDTALTSNMSVTTTPVESPLPPVMPKNVSQQKTVTDDDPLKDIEKFIADGVNLLNHKTNDDSVDNESNGLLIEKPVMAEALNIDSDSQVITTKTKKTATIKSKPVCLSPVPIEEEVSLGVRRSHRIKQKPKAMVNYVSNGTKSTKNYNFTKQLNDLAQMEMINEKFLRAEHILTFTMIRENIYRCPRVISKETIDMHCECYGVPEKARGQYGCFEDCINRMLMIECNEQCGFKDYCANSRFQRQLAAPCRVVRTEKKGFGIVAESQIDPGDFIMEYIGEVIDLDEFDRRRILYARDQHPHFYFMALRTNAIIDSTIKGNISRFINHSCDPNAATQKWTVNGELRIGFFCEKTIMPGEEVTFNYLFQRYGREAQPCYCETAKCCGWIGKEPSSDEEDSSSDDDSSLHDSCAELGIEEENLTTGKVDEAKEKKVGKMPKPIAAVSEMDTDSKTNKQPKMATKASVRKSKSDASKMAMQPLKVQQRKEEKSSNSIVSKKSTCRKSNTHNAQNLEDPDINDELTAIRKIGLKNQANTLRFSRVMVRAKFLATRISLMQILQRGEVPCQRLFLDYHGLRLLHGWINDHSNYLEFRCELIKTLTKLPIPNKTILNDSKVYPTIKSWLNEHSASAETQAKADNNGITKHSAHSNITCEILNSDEKEKVRSLISKWDKLPETFRIPKRERMQRMVEQENETKNKPVVETPEDNLTAAKPLESDRYKRDRFGRDNTNRYVKPGLSNANVANNSNNNNVPIVIINGRNNPTNSTGSNNHFKHENMRRRPDQTTNSVFEHNKHLSKELRREMFERKVARDEAEKRRTEGRHIYEIKCAYFGLDLLNNDPQNLPASENIETGEFYNANGIVVPPPPRCGDVSIPPPIQSTNPAHYQLPDAVNHLPKTWTYSILPNGNLYYIDLVHCRAQWEPPTAEQLMLSETYIADSESGSDDSESGPSISISAEYAASLSPRQLDAYIQEKVNERRNKRYNVLVSVREISPRREEDRIYNQIESRKYKENKEKIRRRKEAYRRQRMDLINATSTKPTNENSHKSLPIQDYLYSSDEDAEIDGLNNSPLIDVIVQDDKIVDEIDALNSRRHMKRALPLPPKPSLLPLPPLNMEPSTSKAAAAAAAAAAAKIKHKLLPIPNASSLETSIIKEPTPIGTLKRHLPVPSLPAEQRNKTNTEDHDQKRRRAEREKRRDERNDERHDERRSVRFHISSTSKEKFQCDIAGVIVETLLPYRKDTCQQARIVSDTDFNHLARRLAHYIMTKEIKYCESIGQTLIVNDSVKHKSREYIKIYMQKYGKIYKRPEHQHD